VYSLHKQFQNLTKVQFVDEDAIARDLASLSPAPSDLKKKSSGTKEKKSKKNKKGESEAVASTPVTISEETIKSGGEENGIKKKKKKDKDAVVKEQPLEVAAPAPVEAAAAAPGPPPPNYIASPKFAGAKLGYVFKKVISLSLRLLASADSTTGFQGRRVLQR
jgi:hypothetical protein